jgi:competence protein ComEC
VIAWVAALGVVLGVLLTPPLGLLLVLVASSLATRRMAVLVLCSCALLGGMRMQETSSSDAVVEALTSSVSVCNVQAEVTNIVNPTGEVLAIERVACLGRWMEVDSLAILQDFEAPPGARMEGTVRFIPLGSDMWATIARRLGAQTKLSAIDLAVTREPTGLQAIARAARSTMKAATDSLGPTTSALVRGLTIGDTEGMPTEDEESLRRAGLTHLVAVSGSNVAIVLGALLLLTRRAGPIIGTPVALAGLFLYVLIVGLEPSVLRAGVMGTIGCFAAVFGRRAEPLAALGAAVAIVLLLQPWLLWSAGLHLSVAATLGIVLWASAIAERVPGPRSLSLAVGVTCAAQVAVAPILITTFGSLSVAGIAANLLAAPAVPIATLVGSVGGLLSVVWMPLGRLVMIPAGLATAWIAQVGRLFGRLSWAEVHLPVAAGIVVAAVLVVPLVSHARTRLERKPGYP